MPDRVRECLDKLLKHYYTTHNVEACKFCAKELDQARAALLKVVCEEVENVNGADLTGGMGDLVNRDDVVKVLEELF